MTGAHVPPRCNVCNCHDAAYDPCHVVPGICCKFDASLIKLSCPFAAGSHKFVGCGADPHISIPRRVACVRLVRASHARLTRLQLIAACQLQRRYVHAFRGRSARRRFDPRRKLAMPLLPGLPFWRLGIPCPRTRVCVKIFKILQFQVVQRFS